MKALASRNINQMLRDITAWDPEPKKAGSKELIYFTPWAQTPSR